MGDGVWEAMTGAERSAFLRGDRSMVRAVSARVDADAGVDVEGVLREARAVLASLGGVPSAEDWFVAAGGASSAGEVLASLPVEDAAVVAARREVLR